MSFIRSASRCKRSTFRKKLQAQRGVALLEFAVILPFLVLFMFGIITFSVAILNKQIMVNATREGARAATTYDSGTAPVDTMLVKTMTEEFLRGRLIDFGASNSDPVVTVTESSGNVKVRASYDYRGLMQLIAGPITAETTMKK